MSSDFRFIVHSSERNSDVFPSEGVCNGLSEAGLAHSRRTVETENRGFHIALELEGRKVFDNPVLHAVQPVMVVVQHFHRVFEIEVVLGISVPRQVCQELEIVELGAVVRGTGILSLEFEQFLFENGLHLI